MAQHQKNRKFGGVWRPQRALPSACTYQSTQNRIAKIEGLEHLKNLEYLALNDNKISKVENLNILKKLLGLNLNNNDIEDF